jgi:putative Mg2+ transporter-C (MgtC) family protein
MHIWEAILQDFADLPDPARLAVVTVRLLFAALLGGLLGFERERMGKEAGLRTYMLVTLGAAFFVIVPQLEGMPVQDMSRVLQGVVTGIGFLGGGAILKLSNERTISGLTTAAGIWFTAAVGIAVGFGRIGTAMIGTVLAYVILSVLYRWERAIDLPHALRKNPPPGDG